MLSFRVTEREGKFAYAQKIFFISLVQQHVEGRPVSYRASWWKRSLCETTACCCMRHPGDSTFLCATVTDLPWRLSGVKRQY